MRHYFQRTFDHRRWANQRTLASVADCPAAQADALPILAHLWAAEHIWLSRLQGEAPTLPIWPSMTLDQCQALGTDCDTGWITYIGGLTDATLHEDIEYRTFHGELCRDTVMDVLTHVFLHGQYHRGQIAKIVGQAGGNPASTDFIVYAHLGHSATS